jgi:hypothetical protein
MKGEVEVVWSRRGINNGDRLRLKVGVRRRWLDDIYTSMGVKKASGNANPSKEKKMLHHLLFFLLKFLYHAR